MIRILFPKQNSRPASDIFIDIIFGALIDKTKTKMGKARPWMLWPYIGNSLMLIMIFAVPTGWGDVAKYAYFFITYTLLNAVFYTANNIAYSALHVSLAADDLQFYHDTSALPSECGKGKRRLGQRASSINLRRTIL